MAKDRSGHILVVGLCCIDTICYVDKYPEEDTDTRVFEMKNTLGGNATNTCMVLNQFENGEGYELLASVPKSNPIIDSLINENKLRISRVEHESVQSPVSTAIVNESNGTRTILHYRGNLPELTLSDFIEKYPLLEKFTWIHFEGRNFDGLVSLIEYCNRTRDSHTTNVSLELEKIRDFNWYDQLIPLVDVIFMSKDFARNLGFKSMQEAVNGFIERYDLDHTTVIIPWAEQGAAARQGKTGHLIVQQAFPPEKVLDTLAAGDCFIGAALYFLNKKRPLNEVLNKACRVAGHKCGQKGLLNLDLHDI